MFNVKCLYCLIVIVTMSCVVEDKTSSEDKNNNNNSQTQANNSAGNLLGTEGQPCNQDGTCKSGLICFDLPPKRCLESEPSTYIKGRILNSKTNETVANCIVKTNPSSQQILSDTQGNYSIYKNIDDNVGKEIQIIAECEGFKRSEAAITIQKGANQAADLLVSLSGTCTLQTNPALMDLGINSGADFITIERISCEENVSWEAQTTEAWLNISPNQGLISEKPQTIKVTVDRSGLKPGDYSSKVNITTTIGEVYLVIVKMRVE